MIAQLHDVLDCIICVFYTRHQVELAVSIASECHVNSTTVLTTNRPVEMYGYRCWPVVFSLTAILAQLQPLHCQLNIITAVLEVRIVLLVRCVCVCVCVFSRDNWRTKSPLTRIFGKTVHTVHNYLSQVQRSRPLRSLTASSSSSSSSFL